MQGKIRSYSYILTLHAEEEMANDNLTIFDIENCILTGEIIERQKDKNTNEWKYIIKGKCYSFRKEMIIVFGKISSTENLVILTVFID